MGYYDYSHYFTQIINNQNSIISTINHISIYLDCLLFLFTCYFLYKFISNMIKGRW